MNMTTTTTYKPTEAAWRAAKLMPIPTMRAAEIIDAEFDEVVKMLREIKKQHGASFTFKMQDRIKSALRKIDGD
jgi:hypothetical protein